MSNKKNYPLLPGQTHIEPYYTQVPTEEYEANMRELKQLRELTAGSRTTIDDIAEIKTLTSEVKALREMNARAQEEIATLKKNQRWRKFPDEKPKWGEEVLVLDKEGDQHIVRFSHDMKWISWGKMNTCESDCIVYWKPLTKAPEEK